MGDKILKRIGITLIFLGIFGFLFMNVNTIGHAISGFNIDDSEPDEIIEIPDIEEIITRIAEKKSISLSITNNGEEELTNCKVSTTNPWISSSQTSIIPGKEEVTFQLKITIPEETKPESYPSELEVNCDQQFNSREFQITVLKNLETIKIKNLIQLKNGVKVKYVFNNQDFIGDNINVELWITNPEDVEITRTVDIFSINPEKLIERDVLLKLPDNSIGVHQVYIALSNNLDNSIKRSIILGKSSTTGNAIFNISKGKGVGYLLFLLFIGIGTFLIFRSHRKNVQKNTTDQGSGLITTNKQP
jgi:hypothetical protein